MKTTLDIECRYCGGCTGRVSPGKGPHAYEVRCQECGKHTKWASTFDIDTHTQEQLQAIIKTAKAVMDDADILGDFPLFMKAKKNLEKAQAKWSKQNERV